MECSLRRMRCEARVFSDPYREKIVADPCLLLFRMMTAFEALTRIE